VIIVIKNTKTMDTRELLRPSAWLARAAADMADVINTEAVAPTGLDPTTVDLLLRLRFAPKGQMRGVDLCNELHKSPSHLSRVVDRAEASGLVKRLPDPKDRRAQLVTATSAGESAVNDYLPGLETVLERVVYSTLTDSEIDTLVELLTKVSVAARGEGPASQ
jgi:DNA-binding MarR family transcriptional regulator